MATEGMNITEEAEMAECDGDKVVTMMDVLQEQQDFEEDANAVLGASDDKNCTYLKGYIKRQAIYACLTCCPDVKTDPTKRAGVCLACSLTCHENHELVELYTKRNFRCDCGNPKFNSNPCQFTSNKTDLNNENIYNQNFSGLYCTCQRPYPDPEATFEDDMIQCIVCEDWLHASHLDAVVPANDQYSEMICKACMSKNDFLHDYSNLAVNVEIVDILTVNGDVAKAFTNNEDKALILNGDVDMTDEKDNNSAKNESVDKYDECTAPQEKTKTSEEEETIPTDATLKDKTDDNMHTDSNNQEPDSTETKETAQDDLIPEKGIQEENEKASDASTDNKMESTNESSETVNEQRETDEQMSNDVIADSENSDKNKTEHQLLDDIKTSTSDSLLEESSTAVECDKVEKISECLEKAEDSISADNSNDKSEGSPSEQTNVGSEAESGPESGNIKVSDASQESLAKENVDDKTDAVMDAIDALLEGNAPAKDSESKEANDELQANELTQGANDLEMCEKPTKQNNTATKDSESKETNDELQANKVTQEANDVEINKHESIENSTTDSKEKADADVEMKDGSSQNEHSNNENKETLVDSENNKSVSVDTTEITNAENKTTSKSLIDTAEKSVVTDTDKLVNSDVNEALNETDITNKVESDGSKNDEDNVSNTTGSTNENKRKLSITEESSPKKVKLNASKCERPKGVKKVYKGATFWPSNFRQKLCTCGECISMYKNLNVLFLTDLEDTVSYYESLGKENIDGIVSQYEKGLQALSSLDRIQQINALTEYNKMRDKLLDFLKSFKDRKEVVKEEDIKAFFAGMKPRREPDGVYFCR
ncbi:unnamed protein product [Arctia plantaginis]|uniref:UBR-type domain-containing protein n=1 Tax=Arctia plantaginis TaxID=874455 RepID=A0A8S0ZXC3_ARCPL|nr:unnamed protein product [Arctia plantaginis]